MAFLEALKAKRLGTYWYYVLGGIGFLGLMGLYIELGWVRFLALMYLVLMLTPMVMGMSGKLKMRWVILWVSVLLLPLLLLFVLLFGRRSIPKRR